ncbi:hypothetical protein J2O02_18220 (plasmid) [Elizabethkingia anophelis]|uniref:hypothetical protein n=1 Tax=Elizabethkingia anophelis TaxID=1117645 RepID=UPI0020B6865E|nr:hypothetical protein [Elizabethkingia anophelis]UTG66802.1 hypothetical protein J2O02_18220 [Elizabethkingia anophelis]
MGKVIYVRDVSDEELELLQKFKDSKYEKSESKAIRLLITEYSKLKQKLNSLEKENGDLRKEITLSKNKNRESKDVLKGLKKLLDSID